MQYSIIFSFLKALSFLAESTNFEVSRAFAQCNISTVLCANRIFINQNKSLKEQECSNITNYTLSEFFVELNLRTNLSCFVYDLEAFFRMNESYNEEKRDQPK